MMYRSVVVTLFVLITAGCGGGGGSSGGGGSDGGGVATSGLLPAAPAPGATLRADASVLRVLRPGSVWVYQGAEEAANRIPKTYTNTVTQVASTTGVDERATNALNGGADSINVRIDAGSIRNRVPLTDLGINETVDVIELRSPVRVNDQYTVFDRRVVEAVADLDGDGKRETLDIAVWSVVVGEETVDLLHRRGLRAVRVDTTALTRVRGTASGAISEIERAVGSVWYANGIGIVRSKFDAASELTPGARDVTTEELAYWDGLSEGLGASTPVNAVWPDGPRAGTSIGRPLLGAGLDNHAVALAGLVFDPDSTTRFTLAKISLQGRVEVATEHAGVSLGGAALEPMALLRLGSELRVIGRQGGGNGDVAMLAFDADGRRLPGSVTRLFAGPAVLPAGLNESPLATATDGNRLWVMWIRPTPGRESEVAIGDLMLAAFAADGATVAPPLVVETGFDFRRLNHMRLAASSSKVLATWQFGIGTADEVQPRYLVVDAGSTLVLAKRPLLDAANFLMTPLVNGDAMLLALTPLASAEAAAVVKLSASFDPLRSTVGAPTTEKVVPSWVNPGYGATSFLIDATKLLIIGGEASRRWPWENNAVPLQTLIDLALPAGPPSTFSSAQYVSRIALFTDPQQLTVAIATLAVAGRIMTIHGSSQGAATVTSWRPSL